MKRAVTVERATPAMAFSGLSGNKIKTTIASKIIVNTKAIELIVALKRAFSILFIELRYICERLIARYENETMRRNTAPYLTNSPSFVKMRISISGKSSDSPKKSMEMETEKVREILKTYWIALKSFLPQYWAVRIPTPVANPK